MERKIILIMHVSLDGYVAGPGGEMDWIAVDNDAFDFVGRMVDNADGVIYGRKTYEMMESYWPTADQQPGATKHDKDHARWYRAVDKLVISKSMSGTVKEHTRFAGDNVVER